MTLSSEGLEQEGEEGIVSPNKMRSRKGVRENNLTLLNIFTAMRVQFNKLEI